MNQQARPRQPAPLRTRVTRREFEAALLRAGSTRREADRAISALQPSVMRAMLPLWRRLRIAWKSRHG